MDSSANNGESYRLAEMDYALWTDYLGDYIAMWQKNSSQFIHEQQHKMLGMAMCPFLFGVTLNLPEAWIKLLYNNGILEKDRVSMRTILSESEMEMSEMAEVIFKRCYQLVEHKGDLKTILNFIYDVEERSKQGNIDLSYALDEIVNKEVFKSMWAPLRKSYEPKKKQAHICIIYFFKTIHQHLVFYGRDGLDKAEFTKRLIAEKNIHKKDITAKQGNTAFKEGNFQRALELYSAVIELDPLNSQLYSNRAQANLQLKNYWAAYCDNKRALLLDSSSSKNYFRAAKLYIEFGQLDKAEEMNKMAMRCVREDSQTESIVLQSKEIEEVKKKICNARLSEIHCLGREKGKENEPPENVVPVEEFSKQLCKGVVAYNSSKYSKALNYFHSALSIINQYSPEAININTDDFLVLNFVHAMSSIYSSINIPSAVEKLKSILHEDELFAAAYYGLGAASLSHHRYKEAENYLNHGLQVLKDFNGKRFLWPQSVQVVHETEPSRLSKLIQDKLKECVPPRPDGVCRFHVDVDNQDKKAIEIYKHSPDYKGFIRLQCTAKCVLDYHRTCWKVFKQNFGDKITDKEMLDIKCPTPQCWGTICVVSIASPNSEVKQFNSSHHERPHSVPRPRIKTKTESQDKIHMKAEKKRLRKERRAQTRLEALEAKRSSDMEKEEKVKPDVQAEDVVQVAAPDCQVTLLKKDDSELLAGNKPKSMKVKKKKEKVKTILNVDLQFAGDEERTRLSAYSLEEEEEKELKPINVNDNVSSAGIMPLPGAHYAAVTKNAKPVGALAALEQQHQLPKPGSDDFKKHLFQLLQNLLKNESIIDLHGALVDDILQSLPNECRSEIESCGGIAQFLRSNPSFNIFRNQFVTLKDQSSGSGLQNKPAAPKPFSWEGRNKSREMAEQLAAADSQKPLTLNPAAKEFFPPSIMGKKSGGYNELDTFELPVAGRSLPATKPVYGALEKEVCDDEGFTPVSSRRPYKAEDKVRAGQSVRSSYHSVDEITMGKPAKSSKMSSIDAIDDNDDDEEEDYVSAPRTHQNSDTSDFSCDRSVSPASTSSSVDRQRVPAAAPMPLKVPKLSLPSRGRKKSLRAPVISRPISSHIAQKLPMSGGSSVSSSIAADEDDRESLASTSDKDSTTDQARASPGALWSAGKVRVKSGSEEPEQAYPGEVRKLIKRDLFDSGVHLSPQQGDQSFAHQSGTSSSGQKGVFNADIWSAKPEVKKDDWLEQNFFPSFSQDSSVPSFADTSKQAANQKQSRVLSQLADHQSLDNSYSISADADVRHVWSNSDSLNDLSWTGAGMVNSTKMTTPEASEHKAHRASTPQDPMDRPILSCKGPWIPQPDIPVTSSPLIQPSSLAPLDTSAMGWMLSGLRSSMDSPLITADIEMPARDYTIRLNTGTFSRTPGKRNPFSTSNKVDFFDLPGKSGRRMSDSEPYFPPSYLDKSEVVHDAKADTTDKYVQTNPHVLSATTQTAVSGDIIQKQENEMARYQDKSNMYQLLNLQQEESNRIIISLQAEIVKERQLRQAAERQAIMLIQEERMKWLERHRELSKKHIKDLEAALDSTKGQKSKHEQLRQKLKGWLLHSELCDKKMSQRQVEIASCDEIMDSLLLASTPGYLTSDHSKTQEFPGHSDSSILDDEFEADNLKTSSNAFGYHSGSDRSSDVSSYHSGSDRNGSSSYGLNDSVFEAPKKAEVSQVKITPRDTMAPLLGSGPSGSVALIRRKGLPLRPLKSAGLLPRPSTSLTSQTQTSFEKIVLAIQETFPGYSRNSILKIIGDLRRDNGGSLSRFTEEMLTREIAERIINEDGVQASGHTAYTPEELLSGRGPRSVNDSCCTICHEMIQFQDALTLDCHHKFHEQCIQKWLDEERSCPNCRKYVVLKEDFPSLR